VAVVTNIDQEHMDHYGSMNAIRETFTNFINKIPFYGTAILCLDNEEIQGIIPRLKKRHMTYGMTSQADLKAKDVEQEGLGVSFEVIFQKQSLGRVTVGLPGEHNVLNALAAIAVGLEFDLDIQVIREGLKNLGGLARRFQVKGEQGNVMVLDDYGHHPTEIMATLKTVRECWPEKRLIVAFQPHRYSRTKELYDRFVISFNEADVLVITSIFAAGEKAIDGVTSEWLAQGIREHGHKDVIICPKQEKVLSDLKSLLKANDIVITLGAGNINQVGEALLKELTC
jgi:UDP-N-acetylmuramate--alanine ligase